MDIAIIVIVALAALSLFFLFTTVHFSRQAEKARFTAAVVESRHQWRIGATEEHGDFIIVSIDYGNTWYAAEKEEVSNSIVIMGGAEEIYPGLLKTLAKDDPLIAHIRNHGPIVIGPDTDFEALANFGIDVIQKEPEVPATQEVAKEASTN